MTKRVVYCADGTWDNSASNTNVYKLSKAALQSASQVISYDDGVGADGTPVEKLLGGALGEGLLSKIKAGYSAIAHSYEPDDGIFLFGFSRGAYTARCLAGMIAICGLPTKNFSGDDHFIDGAFQAYRSRDPDRRAELLKQLNATYEMFDAQISMIGVWDTVGSLGIPAIIGGVDPLIYGFLDTSLHPDVHRAYQALAIDERRTEFPPTLWKGPFGEEQVVEQVWFSGCHCDVGGSNPSDPNGTSLSDLTLAWIISKALELGLAFEPTTKSRYAMPMDPKYALDAIHESWSVKWGLYTRRSIDHRAAISDSVSARINDDASYRPPNLTFANDALAASYQRVHTVA